MKTLPTHLAGILLVEPEVHGDDRGFFVETYRQDRYHSAGINVPFVQDNQSRSRRGTLRGLHYQTAPGQAKLVRVAHGRILDVVLDIRPESPTFGRHETIELDDAHHRQLFVPVGFAHGFLVLSDTADVTYKVSSVFDPSTEAGIAWDDPALGIDWPVAAPIVSARDQSNPPLARALIPRHPA
jgi:dTDP-4-dehydrorhamnose 3,5-epimerase